MCTLSVASALDGSAVRVLMNRDERRLRPVARPPAHHRLEGATAIWPVDPMSGGTWIGATDQGLVLAVLNVDAQRRSDWQLSRGLVVPRFAVCRTLDEVEAEWQVIDRTAFAAFRLVAVSRAGARVYCSISGTVTRHHAGTPLLLASSSLGDDRVEPLRASLFEGLLRREPDPWAAQSRLHAHAWPDRRHLSVMMTRTDAATVSRTEVIVADRQISLVYRPVVEGWPAVPTALTLPIRALAAWAA